MSKPHRRMRTARAGVLLAVGFAFGAIPVAAEASAVNLATASPFVLLAGSSATNTGPSVLDGALGLAPGTSLAGFGLPAVVNGATHDDDSLASQAQADLTNAYNVASGQPVEPGDELTGQNLGGLTLTAGAYSFASSAQLTGTLTLDAQGNPNAQFVFEIGSSLTTASASSVVLTNGASPCNVYWQVGSSAVLGSTTAFQGNLMALDSISLDNGASVIGRLLARNGQVSLINDVLDGSGCGTVTTTPGPTSGESPGTSPGGSTGTSPSGGTPLPPTLTSASSHRGSATFRRSTSIRRAARHGLCTAGFSATVRGRLIKRVVFRLDGTRIGSMTATPFSVSVHAAPGAHEVTAHVTFDDATRAKTFTLAYRACASAVLHPRPGPSEFTG